MELADGAREFLVNVAEDAESVPVGCKVHTTGAYKKLLSQAAISLNRQRSQ